MSLQNEVIAFLTERTGGKFQITLETNLQADLGLDSLDTIELASAVEEKFSIEVSDFRVMSDIKTVGDLADFIAKTKK